MKRENPDVHESVILVVMRRVIVGLAALLAFLAGGLVGARQGQAPPANGIIIGTVIDGVTKKPVPGAVVTLGARGVAQPPVQVGSDGRFVFMNLPPGTYSPTATRTGYIDGGAGQRTPSGPRRPVDLGDVERTADIVLPLWRPAVVTGRIIDEHGEPAVALRVALLHRVLENGEWRLRERYSTRSDDRGMYRFSKIEPSQYVVIAKQDPEAFMESAMTALASDMSALMSMATQLMGSGREPQLDFRARIVPTTFAPGVLSANGAEAIAIAPGEERTGVDVRVAALPTYRISGTLTGPEASPQNVSIQLTSAGLIDLQAGISLGRGGSSFDFAGVPPGEYVLRMIAVPRAAQAEGGGRRGTPIPGGVATSGRGTAAPAYPPAPAASTWWAERTIVITDHDELGVSLPMKEGLRLSGRLQFDGSAAPPAFDRFAIFVASVDTLNGSRTNAPSGVAADGTFRTVGLSPGPYQLRLSGTVSPWRLKSVRADGRDVTDIPIDVQDADIPDIVITLTDRRPGTLSGTVRTGSGQPDGDATVVVFPADRQFWTNLGPTSQRFKSVPVSSGGAYTVANLPDGEYFVLADRDEALTHWLQVKVLEALALRATRVQVNEGERKTQDLTRTGK